MHFNKLSKQSSLNEFPKKLSSCSPFSPKAKPDQTLHQTIKKTNKENPSQTLHQTIKKTNKENPSQTLHQTIKKTNKGSPSQTTSNFFLVKKQNSNLLNMLLQMIQTQLDFSSQHSINDIDATIQGLTLAQCRSILKKIFLVISEKDDPYRSSFKTSEMLDNLKTQQNSRESFRNRQLIHGNGNMISQNSSVSVLHNKVNRVKKTNVNIEFDLSPIYQHVESLENIIKDLKNRGQQKDQQIDKLLDNIIVLNEELMKEENAHEETLKQVDQLKEKQVQFKQMVKQLQGLYLGKCQSYTKIEEQFLKIKEEYEEHERYLIEFDKINPIQSSKVRNKKTNGTRHLSLDLLNQNINLNQQQLDCRQSQESSNNEDRDDNLLRCLLVQAQSIQLMLQNQNACC